MAQVERLAGVAPMAPLSAPDRLRLARLEHIVEVLLRNGLDVVVDSTDTVARLASTTDQSGFALGSTCHLSGENALAYLESGAQAHWHECASNRQLIDRDLPAPG